MLNGTHGSLTKEAHRADESVPLAQIHAAARVLALTAVRFLA
jgi:acetylornithine deacetylase/succinyl-diaminopimelate desuccinylase-like protein